MTCGVSSAEASVFAAYQRLIILHTDIQCYHGFGNGLDEFDKISLFFDKYVSNIILKSEDFSNKKLAFPGYRWLLVQHVPSGIYFLVSVTKSLTYDSFLNWTPMDFCLKIFQNFHSDRYGWSMGNC